MAFKSSPLVSRRGRVWLFRNRRAIQVTRHPFRHLLSFRNLLACLFRRQQKYGAPIHHDPLGIQITKNPLANLLQLSQLHGAFLTFVNERKPICGTYAEREGVRPRVNVPYFNVEIPIGILVVDATSAEPNIPKERAVPLDENHISIAKPASREKQVYRFSSTFLQECIDLIKYSDSKEDQSTDSTGSPRSRPELTTRNQEQRYLRRLLDKNREKANLYSPLSATGQAQQTWMPKTRSTPGSLTLASICSGLLIGTTQRTEKAQFATTKTY